MEGYDNMPKIITIPKEVDLIDQVVNYDQIREIGLFGACFQNIEDKRARVYLERI